MSTTTATPPTRRRTRVRITLGALAAVVGPGLIAGLSDDDPAGITTYSVLGSGYGYRLLWVLTVSTIALILFQDLGARIGVVTGQGLAGLIRQRYGARAGVLSIAALGLANVGTTTAEFAGIVDLKPPVVLDRGAAGIAVGRIGQCERGATAATVQHKIARAGAVGDKTGPDYGRV